MSADPQTEFDAVADELAATSPSQRGAMFVCVQGSVGFGDSPRHYQALALTAS